MVRLPSKLLLKIKSAFGICGIFFLFSCASAEEAPATIDQETNMPVKQEGQLEISNRKFPGSPEMEIETEITVGEYQVRIDSSLWVNVMPGTGDRERRLLGVITCTGLGEEVWPERLRLERLSFVLDGVSHSVPMESIEVVYDQSRSVIEFRDGPRIDTADAIDIEIVFADDETKTNHRVVIANQPVFLAH